MVAVLAISSFDSKRNAIFLLLPIALLAVLSGDRIRVNARQVIGASISSVAILVAVATMSVLRGYGNYDIRSVWDALRVVPDYLTGSLAFAMLGNNLELTYVFFTVHHSVSAAISGAVDLELGATYLRALFVGIPYEVFMFRPPSILDSYTAFADPGFRAMGGSWPPTALGEAFWNFGQFGVAVIPVICVAMDFIYKIVIVSSLRRGICFAAAGLSIYMFMLFFIRGAGLDLTWAYVIVTLLIAIVLMVPLNFVDFGTRR